MRFILMSLLLLFSSLSQAHVRWFVGNRHELEPYAWTAPDFILVGLAVVACIVAVFLSRIRISQIENNAFFKPWPFEMQFRLLGIVLGVWLLLNFYHGEFIAPNLEPNSAWQFSLMLQAICGILLLISHRLASLTLCLFVLIGQLMISVEFELWIDYVPELLGFALALMLASKPDRAVKYLRILLGIQLIILAVHNKLLNPTMGLAFLEMHPWNFLSMMGFTVFTDSNFIIGIGVAEFTLGILLIFGICTRIVAAAVVGVFGLTGSLLGIEELIGHVPIVISFFVVFSLGTGERTFPELNPSSWKLSRVGFKAKEVEAK